MTDQLKQMAERFPPYAYSHETPPRPLWDEDDMRDFAKSVAEMNRAECHGITCVHHNDAERSSMRCPICLEKRAVEAEQDARFAQARLAHIWDEVLSMDSPSKADVIYLFESYATIATQPILTELTSLRAEVERLKQELARKEQALNED